MHNRVLVLTGVLAAPAAVLFLQWHVSAAKSPPDVKYGAAVVGTLHLCAQL